MRMTSRIQRFIFSLMNEWNSLIRWSKNFFSLILTVLFFMVLLQQVHGLLLTCWPYPFRISIARVWYNTIKKEENITQQHFKTQAIKLFWGRAAKHSFYTLHMVDRLTWKPSFFYFFMLHQEADVVGLSIYYSLPSGISSILSLVFLTGLTSIWLIDQ